MRLYIHLWQRTRLVVRHIRVVLDLVVKVLFVHRFHERTDTHFGEFHELGVLAVGRVTAEDRDVGLEKIKD